MSKATGAFNEERRVVSECQKGLSLQKFFPTDGRPRMCIYLPKTTLWPWRLAASCHHCTGTASTLRWASPTCRDLSPGIEKS